MAKKKRQFTEQTLIRKIGDEVTRLLKLAEQSKGQADRIEGEFPNRHGSLAVDHWSDVSDQLAALALLLGNTRERAISAKAETLHAKTELAQEPAQ